MNTKLKSNAAMSHNTVGRPVGSLPVSLKPVVPVECHNGTGLKSRRIKRTPSTGSISSLTSARSVRSDSASSRSRRQSNHRADIDETNSCTEQDVKFHNIESSQPSTGSSQRSSGVKVSTESLSWQEILDRSQETDAYKVYEIILHGENLKCVPDLEKFRKLRVLDLSGNKIKGIQGLDFNKDLRDLKLYDNHLTVIENLNILKELSSLQLQHNGIRKIGSSLSNLKKLNSLRLDNNKIISLDTPELVSCANIKVLDVSNNKLQSLSALNYLPNLEELSAAGNQLSSIGNLSKCKRLQEVDLSHNSLADLSGIANLPNLKIVNASHNRLNSLKSIGKLKSLEELNIASNQISLLSPLVSIFPKLQILNISDNRVEVWDEVCSLSGLEELVELFADGNPFTLEDGEMPTYHLHAPHELPGLEIIDGISIHKKTGKSTSAPLMRPMSAASVITVKQVDTQLDTLTREHEELLNNIGEKFQSLKALFDTLPTEAPSSSRTTPSTAGDVQSRCGSRARLREAQKFAASNFDDSDDFGDI